MPLNKSSIVSIHDVMPNNLENIQELLNLCKKIKPEHLYLLVVPGLDWQTQDLDTLRLWQQQGYQLAGHGWRHKTDNIHSLYHKLHATFISRNVAEHLSLHRSELIEMLNRNYQWFTQNNLTPPDLYVPPAWAMGKLSNDDLRDIPFRFYETSKGIYDSEKDQFLSLPLTGYEADRWWRTPIIKCWNNINLKLASVKRPVRISIHPFDLGYQLEQSLRKQFSEPLPTQDCYKLFSSN